MGKSLGINNIKNNLYNSSFHYIIIICFSFCLRVFLFLGRVSNHTLLVPDPDNYYHLKRIFSIFNNKGVLYNFDFCNGAPAGIYMHWTKIFDYLAALWAAPLFFLSINKFFIEIWLGLFPVFFGVLCCIIVYKIAYEIFQDKNISLINALVFSFLPANTYRSAFSNIDHHIFELLLLCLCLLFFIRIYTQNLNRNFILLGIFYGIAQIVHPETIFFIIIFSLVITFFYNTNILNKFILSLSISIFICCLYLIFDFPLNLYTFDRISLTHILLNSVCLFIFISTLILSKKFKNNIFIKGLYFIFFIFLLFFLLNPLIKSILSAIDFIFASNPWVATASEAQSLFAGKGILNKLISFNYVYGVLGILLPVIIFLFIKSKKILKHNKLIIICCLVYLILAARQKRYNLFLDLPMSILYSFFLYSVLHKKLVKKLNIKISYIIIGVIFFSSFISYIYYEIYNLINTKAQKNIMYKINLNLIKDLEQIREKENIKSIYKPMEKPKINFLAPWDFGSHIMYYVNSGAFASPYHRNLLQNTLGCAFYVSGFTDKILPFLKNNNIKYIITDDDYYSLTQYIKIAGFKFDIFKKFYKKDNYILSKEFFSTNFALLHYADLSDSNPDNIKTPDIPVSLVLESSFYKKYKNNIITRFKIFQVDDCAVLKGVIQPEESIIITTKIKTNINRYFLWTKNIKSDTDGNFTIYLPYAQENVFYNTYAVSGYKIIYKDKIKHLKITEKDLKINKIINYNDL